MQEITLTLVHDKKDNDQQVLDTLALLDPVYTDFHTGEFDKDGNELVVQVVDYYRFKDIAEDHRVDIVHILPYGTEWTETMGSVKSKYTIEYGQEKQDAKDSTDYNTALTYGNGKVALVTDVAQLSADSIMVASKDDQVNGAVIADAKTSPKLDESVSLVAALEVQP